MHRSMWKTSVCVWQKRGFLELHWKYLKWGLEGKKGGAVRENGRCKRLFWNAILTMNEQGYYMREFEWRNNTKRKRKGERERMCLNGLATDIFPLKEGNGISLLLNRHDEWGRSCFWQTLCHKRYRDTSVCVRRSAYVFHKDDFHNKWEKKSRPYKIKDCCKELQYVKDFSLLHNVWYICIFLYLFCLYMYFLLSKEVGAGPLLKTKIANAFIFRQSHESSFAI